MEVVLRCKNDVCVGAVFVNFTTFLIFYVVCLAFHRWGHAVVISCGHTTDFYLGKTDLPRANSSKICLGKFISGFVLPR